MTSCDKWQLQVDYLMLPLISWYKNTSIWINFIVFRGLLTGICHIVPTSLFDSCSSFNRFFLNLKTTYAGQKSKMCLVFYVARLSIASNNVKASWMLSCICICVDSKTFDQFIKYWTIAYITEEPKTYIEKFDCNYRTASCRLLYLGV